MEIAIGKEKLEIGWRHLVIFLVSYVVLPVAVILLLSTLYGIVYNQNMLFASSEITYYFSQYAILIFYLTCSFIALKLAKCLKYDFQEKDIVSLSASLFIITMLVFFITLTLSVFYLPGGEPDSLSFIFRIFVAAVSQLWAALLLYVFLVVLHRNKTLFASELVLASLAVGFIPAVISLFTAQADIGNFAELPSALVFSVFTNGAILAFVAINYVVQQKAKLSQHIYGIAVLSVLVDLLSGEAPLFSLSFALQLFLIYVFGKTLSEKYKKQPDNPNPRTARNPKNPGRTKPQPL